MRAPFIEMAAVSRAPPAFQRSLGFVRLARLFHGLGGLTILFLLQRLRAEGAPRPLVALAFGPGLVVEAVLIR